MHKYPKIKIYLFNFVVITIFNINYFSFEVCLFKNFNYYYYYAFKDHYFSFFINLICFLCFVLKKYII